MAKKAASKDTQEPKEPKVKAGEEPPKKVDRRAELKKIATVMNKEYGAPGEPVMIIGSELKAPLRIPTGILSLDWLHGGGHPRKLFSMYWGPENSGKSTLALTELAAAQAADPEFYALFMDGSGRIDAMLERARAIGVDMSRCFFVKTDTLEEAVEILKQVCKKGLIDMVIVDDLAVYSSVKAQYKGNYNEQRERTMTDQTVGAQALANSQFISRVKDLVYKKNVCVVFTQQVRANLDAYGGDFTLPGGHAIKHILVLNTFIDRGPSGKVPTFDSTADGDHCGFAIRAGITKMQLDGAQYTGTKVVTQFVNGAGIQPGRDAYCFLEDRGLVKSSAASRVIDGVTAELLGLPTDKLKFSGRRACEAWLAEHYEKIYRHFVPNLHLQVRPEESEVLEKKVSASDVAEATEEAKDLLQDPNYQPDPFVGQEEQAL